jgi:hypothetical protein
VTGLQGEAFVLGDLVSDPHYYVKIDNTGDGFEDVADRWP